MAGKVRTGACLCGKISFRATGMELYVVICHCKNCQRNTGSLYSAIAWFRKDHFEWLTNETLLTHYISPNTESGRKVHRWFCSECGTRMMTWSDAAADIVAIPCGVFDGEQVWKSYFECWVKRKVNTIDEVGGTSEERKNRRFEANPDAEAIRRLIKGNL